MAEAYEPGTILFGKYRVESVLGRGGMGVVLRVTHLQLGEDLAIKILLPEFATTPDVMARFLREAQSVVRLRGEHVARVSDVGLLPDGAPYMLMEFLRGIDLAGELQRRRVLPSGEAVDYVLQACEALAEAHAHQIVHRDIKPANLFLTTRPDGTPLVKVLDFGISKAPTHGGFLTRNDTVMGTPGYMSPEQMKATKEVDGRTDIWSLGVVLYEALNGRCPFQAESFAAMVLLAANEPAPAMDPRISRGLQAVVLRCLEKDRDRRFASIAALATALAPFARDHRAAAVIADRAGLMRSGAHRQHETPAAAGTASTSTTLSGSAGAFRAPSRRRRYVFACAGVAVGAIAALAIVGANGRAPAKHDVESPELRVIADHADAAPVADAAIALHPPQTDNCLALQSAQAWQALADCASGLPPELRDRSASYRATAAREAANERVARDVRQQLENRNLKEAEALLNTIDAPSVYVQSLNDTFGKAATLAAQDASRKAQALALAHDCVSLGSYLRQLETTSTAQMLAAVRAVKCVATAAHAPEPDEDDPIITDGPEPSAPPKGSADTPHPVMPRNPPAEICPQTAELLAHAENQYRANFPKAALELLQKALVCKHDVKMFRLATMYACDAGDAAAARLYFAKVPAQFQAPLEQKCQQRDIAVRKP